MTKIFLRLYLKELRLESKNCETSSLEAVAVMKGIIYKVHQDISETLSESRREVIERYHQTLTIHLGNLSSPPGFF